MDTNLEFTPKEMMAYRASQELKDDDVVFVGIGLPNLACNLAKRTHAPNLFMIYESGAVGVLPERLPISIGDPTLVTNSVSIVPQSDIFQLYLQAGKIEVGFLGGAQVDRYGNINTTVIGDYKNPKVRLPGSGGACEIAYHSQRLLIMMSMNPKSFVEKCDFITSPGSKNPDSGKTRSELQIPGAGPKVVITNMGVLEFDQSGEMVFAEIYPGVEIGDVRSNCGWDLKIAKELKHSEPPNEEVIRLLRQELDPKKLYL